MILQTVEPFSSRTDARKAEAAAIHVASFAGMEVVLDDESPEIVTNRAGVVSTRELGPAIALRDGEVKADELGDAVFVSISAAEMDVRPTPFGGAGGGIVCHACTEVLEHIRGETTRCPAHGGAAQGERERDPRELASRP